MSNINTNNIDRQFPEPGKDNDTIGFRNNFSEIANNLDIAGTEIKNLQENVVRTDQANDLNGQKIQDTDLVAVTEQVYDLANISEDSAIDFKNGSFQTVTVTADVTLTLSGWPTAERKASIQVQLTSDGSARTVTWDVEGDGVLKVNQGYEINLYDSTDGSNVTVGGWPAPFEIDSIEDPVLVEFYTVDGGDTVYAIYKGKFV